MRITQSMILRNTLYHVNYNRDEMNDIQRRISSQKKIQKPSDDAVGFSQAVRFRRALERNTQYIKNIEDADGWAGTTSAALDQLYDYSLQAYDLAQNGADGSADAEIRASLAETIRGILEDSVAQANSQYMGKAVFAGTATREQEPFQLENGRVTYTGNDDDIMRRISENVTRPINVTGQDLMDTGLFDALSDTISALENNDPDAVRTAMDQLKLAGKELLKHSTHIGSLRTTLDMVKSRLDNTNINLQDYISEVEDANMEEEIVRFKTQETAYQAALQSASHVLDMNILNYLQ